MRLRHYPPSRRFDTKVMVRHPNFSGLQRDQITQLFTPANFVHDLRVTVANALLFQVEGEFLSAAIRPSASFMMGRATAPSRWSPATPTAAPSGGNSGRPRR